MRRYSRRTLLALPLVIVALVVIVGCENPTLASKDAKQVDQIGPVRITTVVEACSNASIGNADCFPQSAIQLLVGYRVPAGTTAPETLSSSGAHDTSSTTFHKSDSYASELQRLAPAATGEQWVGYI